MATPKNLASVGAWCKANDICVVDDTAKVSRGKPDEQNIPFQTPNFSLSFDKQPIAYAISIAKYRDYLATQCKYKEGDTPEGIIITNLSRQQTSDTRNGIAQAHRVDPEKAKEKETNSKMKNLKDADPEQYAKILAMLEAVKK